MSQGWWRNSINQENGVPRPQSTRRTIVLCEFLHKRDTQPPPAHGVGDRSSAFVPGGDHSDGRRAAVVPRRVNQPTATSFAGPTSTFYQLQVDAASKYKATATAAPPQLWPQLQPIACSSRSCRTSSSSSSQQRLRVPRGGGGEAQNSKQDRKESI